MAGVLLNDTGNQYTVFQNIDFTTGFINATEVGIANYSVATGLSSTSTDSVTVFKRTEALLGIVYFYGFVLQSSDSDDKMPMLVQPPFTYANVNPLRVQVDLRSPPPIPPPKRRIEFLGDSLTCAYGNLGTPPCNYSPSTQATQATLTYIHDLWIVY
jgi:hypothetical protein